MQDIKVSIRKYWDWKSRSFGYDKDKSKIIADTWEAVLRACFKRPPCGPCIFCSYARVQKWLPFYEGLQPEDAGALLQSACFMDIGYFDTACFGVHPYRGNGSAPAVPIFFIAYANK